MIRHTPSILHHPSSIFHFSHVAGQRRAAAGQYHMVVDLRLQRDAVERLGTGAVGEGQLSAACHAEGDVVAEVDNPTVAERFGRI